MSITTVQRESLFELVMDLADGRVTEQESLTGETIGLLPASTALVTDIQLLADYISGLQDQIRDLGYQPRVLGGSRSTDRVLPSEAP